MDLDEALVATVGALVAGQMFPDIAPQGQPYPYVTYSHVGGVPTNTLAGDSNGQNARIQFNVWAQRRDECLTLMKSLKDVVTQPPFRAVSQGEPVAEYNAVTKGRGARQDFSFWYRPST